MRQRLVGAALAVFGLMGAGLLLAGPAAAHASVVTSDPGDGSRLKSVPHTVSVTFDESVGLGTIGYLHVTDANGKRVDARAAYHPAGDGTKVADDLTAGLPDGTYTESYRIISADSHPVAGTIRFVVGTGALAPLSAAASATVNQTTSTFFDLVRWLSFAGLALLGGAWMVLTIWPAGRDERRARVIVWTGWSAVSVGALLELLVQGTYSAGDSLTKIVDTSYFNATLHTNYGLLHCLRLVLLGLLALLLAQSLQPSARPARWESSAGLLAVGVVLTFSAAGHGATTSPAWLSVTVDALHLLSMMSWVGGLVLLVAAVLPRREPAELRAVLPVFSTVAFISVAVLATTGTYSAWRGIGTVHAVLTTSYGLLVVGKVALFIGLLALGNLSRLTVRRRTVAYAMTEATLAGTAAGTAGSAAGTGTVGRGHDVVTERLRRSVSVEVLIAFIVLALSAVLVAEPRGPEALAASYRNPVSATASLGSGHTVTVTADPGVHGAVNVTVFLDSSAQSVTVTATERRAEIGPIQVPLSRTDGGDYSGSATLPVAGNWVFDLVVTRSTFDATTADVTLDLH